MSGKPICHNREPWPETWLRRDCTVWDMPATPTQFVPEFDRMECDGCRWRPADDDLADRLARWNEK